MKYIQLTAATLLLTATAASAQFSGLHFGLKAGGTATHGYTTIPAQPTGIDNVQVPYLDNKNNGIGYGYSVGLYARKDMRKGFIQAEVTYNRFVLKQKTDVTLDVNANPALSNGLPVSFAPGVLNATLNVTSESALESINVPIMIGRRILDGKVRAYFGPNFIFVTKAEAIRNTGGQINANTTIGFAATPIPTSPSTTNLLNKYDAGVLEVKDFTYAADFGLGISPIKNLDLDLRYAIPVGKIYKDKNIGGYLGIATLTLGYRIF